MFKESRLLLCLLIIALLAAGANSQIYVRASETRSWGVERIHAHCLWDNNDDKILDNGANAGNGTLIVVIDTGLDYYIGQSGKVIHPDLADNVARNITDGGAKFYWDPFAQLIEITPGSYEDIYGHGTHVAGILAAVDNDIGVIGVAPKAYIYVMKLATRHHMEVAAAINNAVSIGARIIVTSITTYYNYAEVETACNSAFAHGLLLFASAGNDNNSTICYPAKYSSVIAVGAINKNDQRWAYSNFGSELEFVAPGVDVNSTYLDESYMELSGTSMACPHVAGAAALIWRSKSDPDYTGGVNNTWNNTSVRAKLRDWALDLGDSGWDMYYGYGLINCWAPNQRPLGDINNDLKVDGRDVSIVQRAYDSYPGHPLWDATADINIDNKVDGRDHAIIQKNFGKVDP